MNRSLSVLLPVHNSQATLESDVARILDVLPELSREFDVVIVDDASTDATWEIAEDLACRYRIRYARQPIRQGPAPPFAPASRHPATHVIAHDGHRGVDPQQIVRIREAEARGSRQCHGIAAARFRDRWHRRCSMRALNGHRLGRLHARSAAHCLKKSVAMHRLRTSV